MLFVELFEFRVLAPPPPPPTRPARSKPSPTPKCAVDWELCLWPGHVVHTVKLQFGTPAALFSALVYFLTPRLPNGSTHVVFRRCVGVNGALDAWILTWAFASNTGGYRDGQALSGTDAFRHRISATPTRRRRAMHPASSHPRTCAVSCHALHTNHPVHQATPTLSSKGLVHNPLVQFFTPGQLKNGSFRNFFF